MSKGYKPTEHTKCIDCNKPITEGESYYWSKPRKYPPIFIHKSCYEKLLEINNV